MFGVLRRRLDTVVSNKGITVINSNPQLGYLQNNFFIVRFFSSLKANNNPFEAKTDTRKQKEQSITISYLINSCGLSLESAISVSKQISFKSPERPDSVLKLLKSHKFDTTQISKMVKVCPEIILFDPDKILFPKLKFFHNVGVSITDTAKIFSLCPSLFSRSLENHLIPCYNFLRSVVLLDEKVITTMKRQPRALLQHVGNDMAPNIALLRGIGVPQSRISFLVTNFPCGAFCRHSRFCEIVEEVKEMGFDPSRVAFVEAIHVLFQMKKSTWESKFEVFGSWGWSKDEILSAFRKNPGFIVISEEKVTKAMEFFVNKMGWSSEYFAKTPILLKLSLEKRTIPRCSVVRALLTKGLIRKDLSPATYLNITESEFMRRYVTRFQEDVPHLLNVYQGKMGLEEV